MFRRSETTRIVGLSLAGLSAAVLVAAAAPARPPVATPKAPSADAAPCEAVAVRARELGDARWSAEGTAAVEALVDIVPAAPASAVPEGQVAGDPAVRKALGLTADTPGEIAKRLEMLTLGSVAPAISLPVAVKLAEAFPIEFLTLTNEISELTGKGAEMVKPPAASQPTTACA
jgi:hypothetical protein